MCFGSSKAKSDEEKITSHLKTAARAGGVPAAPLEISTAFREAEADSLRGLAGAMDEVAKGIQGKPMDMDKIERAGRVDKKLLNGFKKGAEGASKSILGALYNFFFG
jgi:hypothetical protein